MNPTSHVMENMGENASDTTLDDIVTWELGHVATDPRAQNLHQDIKESIDPPPMENSWEDYDPICTESKHIDFGPTNPFYQWCLTTKCYALEPGKDKKNKISAEEWTHVLQDGSFGGGLIIPKELHTKFLKAYFMALRSNLRMYVNERKTRIFRLLCDLDFKVDNPLSENDIIQYGRDFIKVVKTFYPLATNNQRFDLMIHKTLPQQGKTGVHMYMPFLYVNIEQALYIREALVNYFKKEYSNHNFKTDWESIVDEDIYGAKRTLRLLGSRKTEVCNCTKTIGQKPATKRIQPNPGCYFCGGRGKYDINRKYHVTAWIINHQVFNIQQGCCQEAEKCCLKMSSDHECLQRYCCHKKRDCWQKICQINHPDYTEIYIRDQFYTFYELCSVRTDMVETSSDFIIPAYTLIDIKSLDNEAKKPRKSSAATIPRGLKVNNSNKVFLNQFGEQWRMIETFITSDKWEWYKFYKDFTIREIFTNDKQSFYIINIQGNDAKYCQNVGRHHSHNHIYFYIDPEGFQQRCYSSSEKFDATQGSCKTFKSKKIYISAELKACLFPFKKFIAPHLLEESDKMFYINDRLAYLKEKIIRYEEHQGESENDQKEPIFKRVPKKRKPRQDVPSSSSVATSSTPMDLINQLQRQLSTTGTLTANDINKLLSQFKN